MKQNNTTPVTTQGSANSYEEEAYPLDQGEPSSSSEHVEESSPENSQVLEQLLEQIIEGIVIEKEVDLNPYSAALNSALKDSSSGSLSENPDVLNQLVTDITGNYDIVDDENGIVQLAAPALLQQAPTQTFFTPAAQAQASTSAVVVNDLSDHDPISLSLNN